jgi:hypothetical protein
MVSSILLDRSARRAAFTLPFPSMPRTARQSPREQIAILFFEKLPNEACDAGDRLQQQAWQGKIRERQNVVERGQNPSSSNGARTGGMMPDQIVVPFGGRRSNGLLLG